MIKQTLRHMTIFLLKSTKSVWENMILGMKMIKIASKDEGSQTKSFIGRRSFDQLLSLIQTAAIIECLSLPLASSVLKQKPSAMNSYKICTPYSYFRQKLDFDPNVCNHGKWCLSWFTHHWFANFLKRFYVWVKSGLIYFLICVCTLFVFCICIWDIFLCRQLLKCLGLGGEWRLNVRVSNCRCRP